MTQIFETLVLELNKFQGQKKCVICFEAELLLLIAPSEKYIFVFKKVWKRTDNKSDTVLQI